MFGKILTNVDKTLLQKMNISPTMLKCCSMAKSESCTEIYTKINMVKHKSISLKKYQRCALHLTVSIKTFVKKLN